MSHTLDDPSLPVLPTSNLKLLGRGISSLVYAVDEYTVAKIAPVFDCKYTTDFLLQDLIIERSIYHHLGQHNRVCQYISSVQRGIILERFGEPLRQHLQQLYKQGKTLSHVQALKWSYQVAEGLAYLHSKYVIQGDIGCHNILLGKNDNIKFCDFGGSSKHKEPHLVRYECRSQRWDEANENPSIQNEIFALGSTIFEIWTTRQPYQDEPDHIVEQNYKIQHFPNVRTLPVAEVIQKCWYSTYTSVDEVVDDLEFLQTESAKE